MAITTYANNPNTTATAVGGGSISSSATSITVASSSSFPAASNTALPATQFHIADPAVPGELITVTNVSGTTWTIARGAEGTTAASHASGATFYQVVSAGDLQNFKQASQAIITQATISSVTTETVLATYTPLSTDIVAGATFAAISYGPVTLHGGATHSNTVAFNLYWGGSGAVNGAFTSTGSTLLASLKTGSNTQALPATSTTLATGCSFDVNGELTLVSSTSAHANLNTWLNVAANLTTAPIVGTCADTTSSGGASTAGPITISGSGPVILTAVFTAGFTVYSLTANSMIYRVA